MTEPSQDEKERSIEAILLKGLSRPKSLWAYLCEIYRALGFRYIFSDAGPAIMMTVAAAIGIIGLYPISLERMPW
jgi:putative exporter of polyketide antibiotics